MQKNNNRSILRYGIYPLLLVILFSCTQQKQAEPITLGYSDFVSELDVIRTKGCAAKDIVEMRKKYGSGCTK
jgi:hypothetical protein